MSRYFRSLFAIFIILVTLALATGVAVGQSPIPPTEMPTVTPSLTPLPTLAPTPSVEERLDTVESEVSDLREEVETPKKDSWDKVEIILGAVAALFVPILIGVATWIYNNRQLETADRHKKLDLDLKEIEL